MSKKVRQEVDNCSDSLMRRLSNPLQRIIKQFLSLRDFAKSYAGINRACRAETADWLSNGLTTVTIDGFLVETPFHRKYQLLIPPPILCTTMRRLRFISARSGASSNPRNVWQSIITMILASHDQLEQLDLSDVTIPVHTFAFAIPKLPRLSCLQLTDDFRSKSTKEQQWLCDNAPALRTLGCWWTFVQPIVKKLHTLRELQLKVDGSIALCITEVLLSTTALESLIVSGWPDADCEDYKIDDLLSTVVKRSLPKITTLGFRDEQLGNLGALYMNQKERHLMIQYGDHKNGVQPEWLGWLPPVDSIFIAHSTIGNGGEHLLRLAPQQLCVTEAWLTAWLTFCLDSNPGALKSVRRLHIYDEELECESVESIAQRMPTLEMLRLSRVLVDSWKAPAPRLGVRLTIEGVCSYGEEVHGDNVRLLRNRWINESNGKICFSSDPCPCCSDDRI